MPATTTEPRTIRRGKNSKIEGNPAVEKLGDDLGINPDASPDEAARRELAESGNEAEAAKAAADAVEYDDDIVELPQVNVNEEPPDVRAEERLSGKTRPAPVPPPRQSKKEREEERLARQQSRPQSPSTRRLGELGKKLPGAEHVKVEKRQPNGSLAYVGNYRMADLTQSQDMETFIAQYIKPSYGAGEYQLTGIDAHGREFDGGTVQILEPLRNADSLPPRESGSVVDVLHTMIRERSRQQPERSVDPIEQLQKLLEVKRSIDAEDHETKAAEGGTLAAMIQAMGQQSQASMNMMMTLLTTILPLMMRKEEDPIMAVLLAKMLEDKGGSSGPLPPPPPPVNLMADMLPIIQVMGEIMKPGGDKANDLLLQHILSTQMGPAQMVELFNSMRTERGTDDFKKSLDNMGFLMNAIRELRSQTEPVQGGWVDAIGALASNRDLASSIAGAIRLKTDARARALPRGAMPAQYAALLPGGDEEAELIRRTELARRRRIEIAESRLAAEEAALAEEHALDPLQHKPRMSREQRHPPLTTPAPLRAVPPAAAPVQDPAVATRQAPTHAAPTLPPDIGDHINTLVGAEDDGALVEGVVNMLYTFSQCDDPQWRQFGETVLGLIHQGDRVQALGFLSSFFEGLRKINLVNQELATRVLKAVQDNFEEIIEHLQNPSTEDDEDEDGDVSLTDELPEGFDAEAEPEDEEEEDDEG